MSERFFIFLILGLVLFHKCSPAQSPQDCYKKYGVSADPPDETDQLQVLKYQCAASCIDPSAAEKFLQILEAEGIEFNMDGYKKMCQRAEDTAENNKKVDECFKSYGIVSKKEPIDPEPSETEKYTCALYCVQPEYIGASLDADLDELEEECETLKSAGSQISFSTIMLFISIMYALVRD